MSVLARDATPQTRVLVITRRDGAKWAHFVVVTPCNIDILLRASF
jgi:hypothetical protein